MDGFKADVIVIAGTYDAKQIISELAGLKLNVAATVTTRYGNELIDKHPNVKVFEKKMTAQGMARFIKQFGAKCLIDASHPFAVEASSNAMKACEKAEIKYLRYERAETFGDSPNIILVNSYEEANKQALLTEGNILLTIGSNNMNIFLSEKPEFVSRLFVRILPDSETIAKCEKAGISRGNIIAMKGPFSKSLNVEIMKHINAKTLITKNSGVVGGTEDKINAAKELGIKVIMIDRPNIEYKEKVGTITEAVYGVGNAIASLTSKEGK